MTSTVSPKEVRIEHSVAEQRALTRTFTGVYALLAVGFLVAAALIRPDLLLGATAFVAFLVWWSWRIRQTRDDEQPWVIVLTPAELRHTAVGVDVKVRRPEAKKVRIAPRGGRLRTSVLEVRGHDHQDLLTVSLPGPNEAVILEAAFEEWDWPLG